MSKIYRNSFRYAKEHGEVAQWKASMRENIACKEGIEQTLRENFDGMHLQKQAASDLVEKFGTERLHFILAVTLSEKEWDKRFSRRNIEWAKGICSDIGDKDVRGEYQVNSHPVIVNGLIDELRDYEIQRAKPKMLSENGDEKKESIMQRLKEKAKSGQRSNIPKPQKKKEMEI